MEKQELKCIKCENPKIVLSCKYGLFCKNCKTIQNPNTTDEQKNIDYIKRSLF